LFTQAIELTEAEEVILTEIKMDPHLLGDYVDAKRNGVLVQKLIKSLISRQAFPEARIRYFVDPNYNVGGRGTSHRAIFERNGTRGENIYGHPRFLPFLRYFLAGAQLPVAVIDSFCREVLNCGAVTSGDIIPLGKWARQQARLHHLESTQAREEFYKLALDCGLSPDHARSIRNAVR
jgi:hypothetical protein